MNPRKANGTTHYTSVFDRIMAEVGTTDPTGVEPGTIERELDDIVICVCDDQLKRIHVLFKSYGKRINEATHQAQMAVLDIIGSINEAMEPTDAGRLAAKFKAFFAPSEARDTAIEQLAALEKSITADSYFQGLLEKYFWAEVAQRYPETSAHGLLVICNDWSIVVREKLPQSDINEALRASFGLDDDPRGPGHSEAFGDMDPDELADMIGVGRHRVRRAHRHRADVN